MKLTQPCWGRRELPSPPPPVRWGPEHPLSEGPWLLGMQKPLKMTSGCQRMHSKASRTWECPTSLEDLLGRPTVPGFFLGSFAGLDIPEVELLGLPALRLDAGELLVHLRLLGPKVRCPQIGITSSHARDLS